MAKIITILTLILLLKLFSTYAADKNENVGRLINTGKFGVNNVKSRKRKRNDSENSKCEECFKNTAENEIYFAHDETHYMSICAECFENYKKPKKNDRILIKNQHVINYLRRWCNYKFEDEHCVINLLLESSKDENDLLKKSDLTVAEIMNEEDQGGSYEIKILDGKNIGKNVFVNANDFTKLAHEIMPDSEICDMCGFFKFNEKACSRYNCDKIICSQCYEKFPRCAYCKLLHKGNAIKVRATSEIFEKLSQTFGQDIFLWPDFELYGIVEDLEFDVEDLNKVFYRIHLALDYNWPRDQQNRIIPGGKLMLVEPIHTITLSEKHIAIFKPDEPEDFDDFQGVASFIQDIQHLFHQSTNVNNDAMFLITPHNLNFRFIIRTNDQEYRPENEEDNDDIFPPARQNTSIMFPQVMFAPVNGEPPHYFNIQNLQPHSTQQQQSQQHDFGNVSIDTSNEEHQVDDVVMTEVLRNDQPSLNIESQLHPEIHEGLENTNNNLETRQELQASDSETILDYHIVVDSDSETILDFNIVDHVQELQASDSETIVDFNIVDHDTDSNSDHSETYTSNNN